MFIGGKNVIFGVFVCMVAAVIRQKVSKNRLGGLFSIDKAH